MSAPNCPYCGNQTSEIMPLIYPGEGVTTFACKQKACVKKVTIYVEDKKNDTCG
jgi:hypothetical protein